MNVLAFPKTSSRNRAPKLRRVCAPAHLGYVAEQPCAVPGCLAPANVHHPRLPWTDACAGRRASDSHSVPLCREHHQGRTGVHARGDEAAWWAMIGVDPERLSGGLWWDSLQAGRAKAA